MPRTTAGMLAILACLVGPAPGAGLRPASADQPPAQERSQTAQERALALYQKSAVEYRAGRFARAVELLREAYSIHPDPTLLYNLARAYEGLGELRAALEAYRSYLATAPRIADRAAIETRVATLESQIRERERLERERALERQARERAERDAARARLRGGEAGDTRSTATRVAPWIVVGAGAAGLATGAVMGIVARDRHADAEAAPSQAEAAALQSDATSFARLANIFYIGGAAVTAAGVVWLAVAMRSHSAARRPAPGRGRTVDARIERRPGGAALLLEGRF